MKSVLQYILKFFAQRILRKYRPKVIGITGSVGKTSTREAVYHVVAYQKTVRETIGNYNNELGVPLTIIGMKSPGMNLVGWFRVFVRAVSLLLFKHNYPEVLVLEMGADKPGDIEYLIDVAPVDIGILTAINEAHLKEFKTLDAIAKEKQKIVTRIKKGRAIVNVDNPHCREIATKLNTNVFTYGITQQADIRAIEVRIAGLDKEFCDTQQEWECAQWGMSFKVQALGSIVPFFIPRVLGVSYVYSALAAIGVGLELGMNLVSISQALQSYTPPKGRMNVIAGIKNTLIVDDTYNAAPVAVESALETVAKINPLQEGRRIAILGDMLELDDETTTLHAMIGRKVYELHFDILVCVGELGALIGHSAREAGMDTQKVLFFKESQGTGNALQQMLGSGDVLLVKGSQGARMEHVVEELMAEPQEASRLLVRQSREWKE